MARLVARKRFTSKKGDLPMVIALNTRTDPLHLSRHEGAQYREVGWGDEEAVQLAEVLPPAHVGDKLTSVSIIRSRIVGQRALAAAFAEGAMPKLEKLWLADNKIGDEGARPSRRRLGSALPELKGLYLGGNQIGDEGAVASRRRLGRGRCRSSGHSLTSNKIGDEGAVASAGGWEGRAAGARSSTSGATNLSDGKGRVGGGRGQEEGVEYGFVGRSFKVPATPHQIRDFPAHVAQNLNLRPRVNANPPVHYAVTTAPHMRSLTRAHNPHVAYGRHRH